MIFWIVLSVSSATREPLDYHQVLAKRVAHRISNLGKENKLEDALLLGDNFIDELFFSPLIQYEQALTANRAGDFEKALVLYNQLLINKPNMMEALYDRGEILLLQQQLDLAEKDLLRLVDLGTQHWVVFFRLAELAGRRGDADALEKYLTAALAHGFSLHALHQSGKHWMLWSQDPQLSRSIRRVITMYGNEEIWEQLQKNNTEQ